MVKQSKPTTRIVTAAVVRFSAIGHGLYSETMAEVTTDQPGGSHDGVLVLGAPAEQAGGKAWARLLEKIARAYCDKQPRNFHVIDLPDPMECPRIVKIKHID